MHPRNRWIWVSAALGLLAVGLLVWALALRSDLDAAQQDLADAQEQLATTKEELDSAQQELASANEELRSAKNVQKVGAGIAAGSLAAAKALYDDLAEQLGAAEEDLAATQRDLDDAQERADQAEQDAAEAAERAAQADDGTAKAQAEADQAAAEAEAAEAQAAIAVDCAKAFVSAFGGLFEGEDLEAQADAVREQFETIAGDCEEALSSSA